MARINGDRVAERLDTNPPLAASARSSESMPMGAEMPGGSF
jgi:hypothetical protein